MRAGGKQSRHFVVAARGGNVVEPRAKPIACVTLESVTMRAPGEPRAPTNWENKENEDKPENAQTGKLGDRRCPQGDSWVLWTSADGVLIWVLSGCVLKRKTRPVKAPANVGCSPTVHLSRNMTDNTHHNQLFHCGKHWNPKPEPTRHVKHPPC